MTSMSLSDERHTCQFSGCGKSFARKEHLVRHARSHEETARHICQFCHREFTRSDSLQRHLVRHVDSPRPSPTSRSKHACVACHVSKIKCDGGKPCPACLKKGAECRYEPRDQDDTRGTTAPPSETPVEEAGRQGPEPRIDVDRSPMPPLIINQNVSPDTDLRVLSDYIPQPTPDAFSSNGNGPVNLQSMRIVRNTPNAHHGRLVFETPQPNSNCSYKDLYPLPEAAGQRYLDSYFAFFHHRWTIVHAVTLDVKSHPSIVVSSMKMIGAWLTGTQDARWLAIAIHERLMAYVIPQLLQLSSSDNVDDSPLITLYQGSLLNIIFALYCGVEGIVSRAILLRNILVGVLREVGFFNPEISFDNPKIFLPTRLLRQETRKRLAAYLFKVDSYLSILRTQPTLFTVNDLHYVLPSTFSLHNADGLDIFDTRYSIEPAVRSHTSMCHLIQDTSMDAGASADGLMLAEDIQLGICSLQSRLYHRTIQSRLPDFSTAIELNNLKKRLESWKLLLTQIPISASDASNFSAGQHWATRYYYGMEDHSKPGWQNTVYYRKKTLVYDAIALYHLSSLRLYSNSLVLRQLAEDMIPNPSAERYGDIYQQAQRRRNTFISEWAVASNSRRALCHAAALLRSYHDIPIHLKPAMDPIIYVAISMGALVVWAYVSFGSHNCEACNPVMRSSTEPRNLQQLEITRWSEIDLEPALDKEKEDWIGAGDAVVTINGIIVCRCSLFSLVSSYHSFLPEGWDVANTIAPGIFNSEDVRMGG